MYINKALTYKYQAKCPRCSIEAIFYILVPESNTNRIDAGEITCKCGYKGLATMKYLGQEYHQTKGKLINPGVNNEI